jgi:hypothetical protein
MDQALTATHLAHLALWCRLTMLRGKRQAAHEREQADDA